MGHPLTRYERFATLYKGMAHYREEPEASRISFDVLGEDVKFVLSELEWNVLRLVLGPKISWEVRPVIVEGQPALRVALTNVSKFLPESAPAPK